MYLEKTSDSSREISKSLYYEYQAVFVREVTCYKVCMWIIIKSSLLRSYAIVLNDIYRQKIFHYNSASEVDGVNRCGNTKLITSEVPIITR